VTFSVLSLFFVLSLFPELRGERPGPSLIYRPIDSVEIRERGTRHSDLHGLASSKVPTLQKSHHIALSKYMFSTVHPVQLPEPRGCRRNMYSSPMFMETKVAWE
jgi:hypothetical protein